MFCEHLLAFYRGVAQALGPIRVTLQRNADLVRLDSMALTAAGISDLVQAVDPPPPGTTIR